MTRLKRIYHPYQKWEEINYNMWGSVANRAECLEIAIEFTGNHKLYGFWMREVSRDWPYSCEHNLTDKTQNRKAWIGHAACAYALEIPEDIIRKAWSFLTEYQQAKANAQAAKAIKDWELRQCQKEDWEQMSMTPLWSD